jgi:hypothetical protein
LSDASTTRGIRQTQRMRDKVNRREIRAKSGQDRAGVMVCGPIETNWSVLGGTP